MVDGGVGVFGDLHVGESVTAASYNVPFADGAILYADNGAITDVGIGANTYLLTSDGSKPVWSAPPSQTSTSHMELTETSGVGLKVDRKATPSAPPPARPSFLVASPSARTRTWAEPFPQLVDDFHEYCNWRARSLRRRRHRGRAKRGRPTKLRERYAQRQRDRVRAGVGVFGRLHQQSRPPQTAYFIIYRLLAHWSLSAARTWAAASTEGDIQTNANLLVTGTITSNAPPAVGAGGSKAFSTLETLRPTPTSTPEATSSAPAGSRS